MHAIAILVASALLGGHTPDSRWPSCPDPSVCAHIAFLDCNYGPARAKYEYAQVIGAGAAGTIKYRCTHERDVRRRRY